MPAKPTRRKRQKKAPAKLVYFPGCGPWSREPTIQPIELDDDLGSFGYATGETIHALSADRLKLEDAAALDTPEGICIGRVFHLDRQGVTLRVEDGGDCYHAWAEVKWAGRITGAAKGEEWPEYIPG
jgi:hypothetical protein